MKKTDIKDERFGMLTAIEPTDGRDFGNVIWKCKCDCGKIVYKSTNYLNKDRMCSCGCYAKIQYQKRRLDISDQRFGSLVALECNAALCSRRKKHFIFDSINTITAPSFR